MGKIEGALLVGDRPAPPHYGQTDQIIKLVDLSQHPVKNQRILKLGNFWGTHGGLVCDYDVATNKVSLADGILAPGTQRSISPFEPDNWLYRIHSKGGPDRVWSTRLIVDHTNKHNEEKNRSTYVIDQRGTQRQGHLSEVFWVKDVGVKIGSNLLKLNGAGQTAAICQQKRGGFRADVSTGGSGNPDDQRYHLCFNVNKEAGFITDGGRIGQLRRLMVVDPWMQSGKNADGEAFVHAAIPSDVYFSANPGQWGPLAFFCGNLPYTDGDYLVGYHWWFAPREQCRQNKDYTDDSEDGKQISPLEPPKNIWVFVKQAAEWVPTPGHNPPGLPPGGGVVATFAGAFAGAPPPVGGGVGSFVTWDFAPGFIKAFQSYIPIPEHLPVDRSINLQFEWITPAGGIIAPAIKVQFDYAIVQKGASAAPLVLTGSLTRLLTAAAFPGSKILYRLIFKIPPTELKDAAGGKIAWAFGRRGDLDASLQAFNLAGSEWSFSAVIKE